MEPRRRGLLAATIAGAVLSLALAVATGTPVIASGPTLPPLAAAAVLIPARRRDPALLAAHLAAFTWGALGAASLASATNEALSGWVTTLAGDESARAFVP